MGSMAEFKSAIKFPYVVIATNEYLQNGLSQQVFVNLSAHSSNQILLTQRVTSTSLAGKLLDIVMHEKKDRNVKFIAYRKERLNAQERDAYLAKKREQECAVKEKEQKEREDAIAFEE